MENAKTLARLIIIAVHAKNVEISPYWILAKEVTIKGSRGYTAQDILTAVRTLDDPACRLDKIVTQIYAHEDLKQAFETAADPQHAIKVVIDYEK